MRAFLSTFLTMLLISTFSYGRDRALILANEEDMFGPLVADWQSGLKNMGWYVRVVGRSDRDDIEKSQISKKNLLQALSDEVSIAKKEKGNFLFLLGTHGIDQPDYNASTSTWDHNYENYRFSVGKNKVSDFQETAELLKQIDDANENNKVIFINFSCFSGNVIHYLQGSSVCTLTGANDKIYAISMEVQDNEGFGGNYIKNMGRLLSEESLEDNRLKNVVSNGINQVSEAMKTRKINGASFLDLEATFPSIFSYGFGLETLNTANIHKWFERYGLLPISKDEQFQKIYASKKDPNKQEMVNDPGWIHEKLALDISQVIWANPKTKLISKAHHEQMITVVSMMYGILIDPDGNADANMEQCILNGEKYNDEECAVILKIWKQLKHSERVQIKQMVQKYEGKKTLPPIPVRAVLPVNGEKSMNRLEDYYPDLMSKAFEQTKGSCAEFDLDRKKYFIQSSLK